MDDERQVRPGFLPPKAPGGGAPPRFQPPAAPQPQAAAPVPDRPVFVTQRMESGPRSGVAMTGTIVGAVSLVLLLLTIGFAYPVCLVLSTASLILGLIARQQIRERGVGRAGQARAAIWVGGIGIAAALAAWFALDLTGFSQQDLERWLEDLERELEQRQSRPGGGGRNDVPA